MILGCNTLSFAESRQDAEAIEIIATAGFKSIDLNLNKYAVRSPINRFWISSADSRLQYAATIKKKAKELGICIGQVHSPYPTFLKTRARGKK